jgi:hypothetical protein
MPQSSDIQDVQHKPRYAFLLELSASILGHRVHTLCFYTEVSHQFPRFNFPGSVVSHAVVVLLPDLCTTNQHLQLPKFCP